MFILKKRKIRIEQNDNVKTNVVHKNNVLIKIEELNLSRRIYLEQTMFKREYYTLRMCETD